MTKLLYLQNTYQFELQQAQVIEFKTLEDGRTALILDQTIFYPQGGGQPCDTGIITAPQGQFIVKDVRLDKDGIVYHIGDFQGTSFVVGETVALKIDSERRLQNSRLHSAGHLIDCAVKQLALPVMPTKGYHFADGPNVEYDGIIDNSPETIQAIQEKIDTLIKQNIAITAHDLSQQEAQNRGIIAPAGKSVRMVNFVGFESCGCGGTHVRSAGEIGKIIIRKIKTKGGVSKVSYAIA